MLNLTALAPTVAGVLLLCALPATSSAQPDSSDAPHAKPRLISEYSSLVPGGETWLGVTFDIDKDWHIYWDGLGDTGQPVKAEFSVPAGYSVGETVWPTPERQVLPGEILDYVYHRRVTLLVRLRAPSTAKSGDKARISAKLGWMECADSCIPRKASVSLELPVSSAADRQISSDSKRFEEARKRIPKPVSETEKTVKTEWNGATLVLTVPGASGLTFYPHSSSAPLADPIRLGEGKDERLSLKFEPGDKTRVVGILEVRRGKADSEKGVAREFYALDLPLPGSKPPASTSKTKDPLPPSPSDPKK